MRVEFCKDGSYKFHYDTMQERDIRPLTEAETQWKVAQAIKRAVDNFVPSRVKPAIAGLTIVKEM